jgi:hypothetical protein
MTKFWMGSTPTRCELCNTKLKFLFVDGKTVWGTWGIFCPKCLDDCGIGVGPGRGQLYLRVEDKRDSGSPKWMKISG